MEFPKANFPPDAKDFVMALLRRDAKDRLPLRPGGIANLRGHAWYKGFDWDSLGEGTLEPPYKPVVKSQNDSGNFTARKEDMPRQIEFNDDGSGIFNGFGE